MIKKKKKSLQNPGRRVFLGLSGLAAVGYFVSLKYGEERNDQVQATDNTVSAPGRDDTTVDSTRVRIGANDW